mgnify:CR=1 FL=1
MKLLYITNGINGPGGLERVLSIKASYLAEHYHYDVTILSLNDNHLDPFYTFSDKITMLSIPVSGHPLQYIKAYTSGIKKVVAEVQPDVISVCDDGLKAFFTPLILGKKVPIIYERHASVNLNFYKSSGCLSKFKNKLQYTFIQYAAKHFDKFVVLTNGNLKEWRCSNLKVIPNPLSFYPEDSSLLQKKTVIVVGSHSYNKGYDLLLDAWEKVISKYPKWQLHVYGKIDADETYLKLSKKMKLTDSINFYNPVRYIEDKYLEACIMVLPSRSEGFGMVLIEAMACGVPCVSFNCPVGPADIIKDGVDGFLVENQNVKQLADRICTLIDNDILRSEMGAKAKENVKRYLLEMIIKQWDELFKSLVS